MNKDMCDVTKEERKIGKTLRHSNNYISGPAVIANELGILLNEAKLLSKTYMLRNGALSTWHDKILKDLRVSRTFVNCFGRSHRFLERWGDDLHRSACSYNPQSTIGDLLNRALRRVYEDVEYDILLQLHDAMYLEVEDSKVDKCIEEIREIMLIPITIFGEEV